MPLYVACALGIWFFFGVLWVCYFSFTCDCCECDFILCSNSQITNEYFLFACLPTRSEKDQRETKMQYRAEDNEGCVTRVTRKINSDGFNATKNLSSTLPYSMPVQTRTVVIVPTSTLRYSRSGTALTYAASVAPVFVVTVRVAARWCYRPSASL